MNAQAAAAAKPAAPSLNVPSGDAILSGWQSSPAEGVNGEIVNEPNVPGMLL